MLYSRTAKYAVLALAEIANRESEQPVSTRAIASATEVPYALLAKIIGQLRRAGLVDASRGKLGGIRLARPARDIAVWDVVEAIDGRGLLEDCPLYLKPCRCERECSLHSIWKHARDAVADFLENTSLADVAVARRGLEEPE